MDTLIGPGTLQERLASSNLFLIRLTHDKEAAFPNRSDLNNRLADAQRKIGSDAPPLSDGHAQKVATEILSLFTEATRAARHAVGAPDID